MNTRNSMHLLRKATASALLATLLLVGCGGEKPETMLSSAKAFLAKNDHKAAAIQLKNALQQDPQLPEARFLLAKALLEGGDPTGAEVELRKAQNLNYPADQVTPLLARTMLMLGQPEKVTEELAKVQLTTPEAKADLQTSVGQAYLMQGKEEQAAAAYAAAVVAQPGHAPALLGEARLKAGRGDLPGALALLDSALEKQPRLYDAWQLKGDLFAAQGDAAAATNAYRKALEIKPDYLPAHSAIVRILLAEGKLDDAGKQIEVLKQIAPNHPQTQYLRAMLAYQQKDYAAARDAILLHLKVVPESPLGLQLAGLIEYDSQAFPQAEAYLLKALPRTPPLSIARRVLIASYLRNAQPSKALGVLEPVLDKIDKDSNMLALAGQVFLQNGQVDKAGTYFAKATALDPKNPAKRTSLAMVNMAKGDSDVAFRDLEQVAAADTGSRADLALIAAHLQRREFDQALKAIAVLEKKQPDNPLTHNLRGTALLGKRDVAAARKSFEKALALNPAYFPAAANLANLDLNEKKPEDARKRFESVLEKDPKNVQAFMALAQLRAKAGGTTAEIATLIGKAVTANPTDPAPRLALIGLYLGKKETKSALSAAQEAVAALPERPEILDAAGRAQQAAEDYNQALATYGKMAALQPNSPLPYLRMAEIQVAAKNKDAALQNLQKALQVKPDSLEAQRGIMLLDLDAGRSKEALEVAREVQKQRPKEAIGYLFEGDAHAAKKAWVEAAAAYRVGLKEAPSADLAVKLHTALLAGGNTAEADKFAETWLKEHAKDNRFRLYLAEMSGARKDYAGAARQYRILLEAQPENPVVLNNMAWVAGQLKDPKAIEYAEKANKLAPDQPALLDTLAVLLMDKGDAARALGLFKKALELAPQASQIRLNYARALIKAGKNSEARSELDQLAKLGDKFPAQAEVAQLLKGL
ncbi:MAG: tetratricopeptide repeat protein [Candidatus Accumulibacter phosphatis]|uniref:Tetratricopeptide repeat protein n=1 Tax=Candidatus Accumulibacter phosphatis TaxID=327160 RepID=A0A080M7Q8_9PROT|nr:XrtA/PEP-CTERM system TPR-repeat protein PrsT [Accumulibacter sp.]KFB73124.1 MAG: tetratricopeptide repeat protein [Candidatus Accumulibacter phosphatis]MBL8409421.1 PEP-CTERM system TPR-repeat protein PrsT [Accumulibacter sp.]HRF10518.1 PEP-CTERM system TPR-repeat protein PrsT [Candidatus Accumulibacter phosphatis]